jgi:hypothetical protein
MFSSYILSSLPPAPPWRVAGPLYRNDTNYGKRGKVGINHSVALARRNACRSQSNVIVSLLFSNFNENLNGTTILVKLIQCNGGAWGERSTAPTHSRPRH